jgi:hypothetical protein
MSNSFRNFLGNNGNGTSFKSYAHATSLYVNGNFSLAPKLGFLYFVSFTINPAAIGDSQWAEFGPEDVGILVKRIDMPKFKISTETINQYNRKTNIQTKITYDPVNVEFHDDNSEITNSLWKNYYKYYFADSNYGDALGSLSSQSPAFSDSKYGETDNPYGFNTPKQDPFFKSIDIYVLHQGNFTQIQLVNPIISAWDHDNLDQSNGTKALQNKMTLVYENVFYTQGKIIEDEGAERYSAVYYDREASPLAVGSNPQNSQVKPQDVLGSKPQPAPRPIPQYPAPPPVGYSQSQVNKAAAQKGPTYAMPRPIGSGTVGLGQGQRPGGFSISGISIWSGYGGAHGKAVVQAGPIRLVLKK